MSRCERLQSCPFFNDQMAHMPVLADQIKKRYCFREWDSCARFRVFKALGPDALLPMIELVAIDSPPRAGMSDNAWTALRAAKVPSPEPDCLLTEERRAEA